MSDESTPDLPSSPGETGAAETTVTSDEPNERPMFATAPPPAWSPGWAPASGESAPRVGVRSARRVSRFATAVIAVAALAIGILATTLVIQGRPGSSGVAEVHVGGPATGGGTPGTTETVANKLGPATGTIVARASSGGTTSNLGSGFVISHDGGTSYLVTNNHVVSGAKDLHVVMPGGRTLTATLVGTDKLDDVAVVSVGDGSLPMAVFGSSKDLKVGQPVVAIGSPLGNEGSVTQGVVSALHRTISAGAGGSSSTETLQDVLQTDASINQGNSGGPLADANGQVVGVNVAIAGNGSSNIGFSIPADLARRVAEELIVHRTVGHPFLGIAYYTPVEAIEEGQSFDGPGVLVHEVRGGTPADKAGFKVNDILQKIDGVALDNGQTVGGLVQDHSVGDTVSFTVKRGDQISTLTATLVDRPATAQ